MNGSTATMTDDIDVDEAVDKVMDEMLLLQIIPKFFSDFLKFPVKMHDNMIQ